MPTRKPYSGTQRKLVLAFDIGTTFSGISYSILDPGLVPQVRGVTRYPAQAHVGGDCKIPSIIWYDAQGTARAIGAEALQPSILAKAVDENWVPARWWKLHLRPQNLAFSQSRSANKDMPPLPANKSAIEVLVDFMRYLHQCARSYIHEAHPGGQALWASLENQTDFVLTHPNGWEGAQQSEISRAAVLAGLVPDTDAGQSRIQLATEGEASLHYCIWNGLLSAGTVANGQGIIIVDAGGGTIDLSAYYMSPSSDSFEEIAPTDCIVQGSAVITHRATLLIADKLRGSKYEDVDSINEITTCFDRTTKLRFRGPKEPQYIKFGSLRDKDPDFNIKHGQLTLLGSEVEALFEPSIQAIINAIEAQRRAAHETISSIFLVGGFAASDWLFKQLEEYFLPRKITFSRPDGYANKAVADGAVSFYLDNRISAERRGSRANLERQLRELQGRLTESQLEGEAQRKRYEDEIRGMAQEYQDKLARSQSQHHAIMEMLLHQEQEAKIRQAELHQIQVEHAQVKALLKARTDELGTQRGKYEDQIRGMARDLEEQHSRVRRYKDNLARSQSEHHAIMEDIRSHHEQQARIRQAESHQIQVEHAQVKELLKVRTDELSGAQSFPNKADLLSGAEVIAMVDALNSEILQAAASIAESFEFRKVNATAGSEQEAACERVRVDFGHKMAHLLASVQHAEDPMLIQIALQSRLIRDCKTIIESWCFDKLHDHLVGLYEVVRKTEDQAVSGRWRALTHSHVRLLRDGGQAATLQHSKDIIANNLADVLIAGGYHESSEKVREIVMARFNDGITTIANLALRLNQTIGEEVTSCDLGVVYVRDGVAFDPENMEDIGGEGAHPSKADKVLCTTDLGLQQGAKEANGNRTSVLLLKPGVVMESLTKDMSRG